MFQTSPVIAAGAAIRYIRTPGKAILELFLHGFCKRLIGFRAPIHLQ
jgi:hypothetical protein